MKITTEQLRIYRKYNGDDDGLALVGLPEEQKAVRGADWQEIRQLIQSLHLASSGLASDEFRVAAIQAAGTRCADEDAKNLLIELATTRA